VASIDICGGELKCEFIPDFIEEFRSTTAINTTRVQPMTHLGGSSTSRLNRTTSNTTGTTVKGGINDRIRPNSALLSRSASTNFNNNEIQRPSSSHSMRSVSTTNTNLTSANFTRLQKVNIENSQRVRSSSTTAGKISGNNFDIDADRNISSKRATRNGEGVFIGHLSVVIIDIVLYLCLSGWSI
jgi:hypothetical protein